MSFSKKLGLNEIPTGADVIHREAVRGVALEGNVILMIHTSNNDYKFPGGGIEAGEDHLAALKREFIEETGYLISDEIEFVGEITEQKKDKFTENAYFCMKSYYYKCKITEKKQEQQLDSYEKDLNFKAEFISVFDAYNNNLSLNIQETAAKGSPWVERETIALEYILNNSEAK
ncbi:MAG: NUDIX domain-containing protein [Ruminococcus sp.]|nr:NUDIX domain-containing protein [Ruminococcus sp.]